MTMDSSDFLQEDCDSIAAEMKEQEERIRLKRRWLLGLDTPHTTEFLETEDHTPGKTEFLESECLPESLLREDDLFYETAKTHVEEAFGFCKNHQHQESQRKDSKFCSKDVVRKLITYLDSLTNEGLSLVANILTGGGSTSFDKTRLKMKQIIRESIRTELRSDDIVEHLHQALYDPSNFRKDSAKPMFPSHREAALKVLNELDKLSTQTLLAMRRKLEGSVMIPLLKPSKRNVNKINLINQVRQACEKMLSEEDNKLQEPLAKAMSLVNLSLKLTPGYNKTTAPTDFFQFSPETKKLQKEIVKAVWLLRTARIDAAFERVGLILDPEAEVSNHSLRSATERMLVDYLFECCDMDVIPNSLTNALSFVNKSMSADHKVVPGEAVEEETECILNVSAQVKQIVWQCLPDYELDEDFGDAYMEELEDSDDDDDYSQDTSEPDHDDVVVGAECSVLDPAASSSDATNEHHISSSLVIRDLTESSITRASLFVTPTSKKSTLVSDRHDVGTTKTGRDIEVGVDNQLSTRSLYSIENIKSDDHGAQQNQLKRKKNQYLSVQETCDDTSLVAYNLIGRLLEKFAEQKGLDLEVDQRSYLRGESKLQEGEVSGEKQTKSDEFITLSAVKEIIPSIDKSVLLKLKELME